MIDFNVDEIPQKLHDGKLSELLLLKENHGMFGYKEQVVLSEALNTIKGNQTGSFVDLAEKLVSIFYFVAQEMALPISFTKGFRFKDEDVLKIWRYIQNHSDEYGEGYKFSFIDIHELYHFYVSFFESDEVKENDISKEIEDYLETTL